MSSQIRPFGSADQDHLPSTPNQHLQHPSPQNSATNSTPQPPPQIQNTSTPTPSISINDPQINSLVNVLLTIWDREQRGYIYATDIICPPTPDKKPLDIKFIQAIRRVLCGYCSLQVNPSQVPGEVLKLYPQGITKCITLLKHGTLAEQVQLLMYFMDIDGNQSISFVELQQYLKVQDNEMLQTLRSSIKHSGKHSSSSPVEQETEKMELFYEDMLYLFQTSQYGKDAIAIFGQHILRLLQQSFAFTTKPSPSSVASKTSHSASLGGEKGGGKGMDSSVNSSSIGTLPSSTERNSLGISSSTGNSAVKNSPANSSAIHTAGTSKSTPTSKSPTKPLLLPSSSFQSLFSTWYEILTSKEYGSKSILMALQIVLFLYYFFVHLNLRFPLEICIAKGFGLNLRILSIPLYLSMARTLMGQLYAFRWLRLLIPLGININIHSFLGISILLHSIGHTFAHLSYRVHMYGISKADAGLLTVFIEHYGSNWKRQMSGDGNSGIALFIGVVIMSLCALCRGGSSDKYRIFAISHYFYVLYLPLLFIHVPMLYPYFISIMIIMVIERLFDFFHQTTTTTLQYSRPCGHGVSLISIPKGYLQSYPGAYYRLNIPQLSWLEWHPFSLAGSTSSNTLTFFIASTGDWTTQLHALLSNPTLRNEITIHVQGPFLAPASLAPLRHANSRILCVASGIGITPFFSLIATKVFDVVNDANDRQLYTTLFHEEEGKGSSKQRGLSLSQQGTRSTWHSLHSRWAKVQPTLQNVSKRPSTRFFGSLGSTKTMVVTNVEGDNELKITPTSQSVSRKKPSFMASWRSAKETLPFDEIASSISGENNTNTSEDVEKKLVENTITSSASSKLKIVWSIRDMSELRFYLDYVYHLVKSQTQLLGMPDLELGTEGNQPPQQQESDAVVEVEVYLTGLGTTSDPGYMLSQTLFLLSLANHHQSSYMKICFGRPNFQTIFTSSTPTTSVLDEKKLQIQPTEACWNQVYYCGGQALKQSVQTHCLQWNIPFHPEDFDSGGNGLFLQAIQGVRRVWKRCFEHPIPSTPVVGKPTASTTEK